MLLVTARRASIRKARVHFCRKDRQLPLKIAAAVLVTKSSHRENASRFRQALSEPTVASLPRIAPVTSASEFAERDCSMRTELFSRSWIEPFFDIHRPVLRRPFRMGP